MKLPHISLDATIVCKTVIGIVPDDYMVKDLDHEEVSRPDQIAREFSILRGWCRVTGWVVVDKDHGGSPVFKGKGQHLPWVHGTTREAAQKDVLIKDQFVFAIEEKDLEDLPLEIPHGMEEIVKDGL